MRGGSRLEDRKAEWNLGAAGLGLGADEEARDYELEVIGCKRLKRNDLELLESACDERWKSGKNCGSRLKSFSFVVKYLRMIHAFE
jgi:hypothetical protein